MGYLNDNTDKPVIGITLGDFNGIGPELILKTLADNRILKICIPVIYGSFKVLSKYRKILETEEFSLHQIRAIDGLHNKKANLVTCWEEEYEINPGTVSPEAGKCAYISLSRAATDLQEGKIDALVTSPINKSNMPAEEFPFPGHTEYFASRFQVNDYLMLMVSQELRVGVITGHIPLNEVKSKLSKELITSRINILNKSLKSDFGIIKPKIALLGLNPHAGEGGKIGNEENELIAPIVEEIKQKGLLVSGPFPSDGFFGTLHYKKFDGILAMYHDQGLIPFKTLAFESGVNFTAGLPCIRTSPDHGTAYDIAGKNIASETSFLEAIFTACDVVKNRKPVTA